MIKAVLFDLDGTLANTLGDIADSLNLAFADYGLPRRPESDFKRYTGSGTKVMVERALGGITPPCPLEELIARYRGYYSQSLLNRTKPYPGMPETVTELRNRGVKLGVVTNKSQDYSLTIVNALYPGCFDTVQGNRDQNSGGKGKYPEKPNPALPAMAAADLGALPGECLFAGDSDIDIYTAKNFGCRGVGVLWGFRPAEELRNAGADLLVSHPRELIEAVFG